MAREIIPNIDLLPASALLTHKQVSLLSGFAYPTIRKWLREGRGPRVTYLEGLPRYRVGDVRSWLKGDANKKAPCPQTQETV